MPNSFSESERERYSRHFILPQVGEAGQARLKAASVLCIGAGGLGSPVALYLAAAGVGRIGIVDDDQVDLSNLQRQLLHGTPDLGRDKIESATDRLRSMNPEVAVVGHPVRLVADNVREVFADYDIIVDGSDNFPTRFLVNDAAFLLKKPLVAGAIYQFDGQLTVFDQSPASPCYRCLLPELPAPGSVPSCNEAGVLGALPGVIGTLQAMEVLKLILGKGDSLSGRMMHYDAMAARFRELKLGKNPSCALCGDAPTITEPVDLEFSCSAGAAGGDIDVQELRQVLENGFDGVLLDVRQPEEHAAGHIEGATLVPLGTLPSVIAGMSPDDTYLVYCKVGQRSAHAVAFMEQAGFHKARNVTGGILAWHRAFGREMLR